MDSFRPKKTPSADRFLGLQNHSPSSSSSCPLELHEADIFDQSPNPNPSPSPSPSPNSARAPFWRSLARPIPRTLAPKVTRRHSAPLRIPAAGGMVGAAVERGDGEEERMVPPHLMVDRAKGNLSVLDGAGRTLKGRDLTNVRNGVLRKTGFLE